MTETTEPGYIRKFYQGIVRIRIGFLPGSHRADQPDESKHKTDPEEIYHEVTIEFRDRSHLDKPQQQVWELHEQGKLRKEIGRELAISKSRVTVLLQQAAAARGIPLIDGRKQRSPRKPPSTETDS